MRSTKTLIGAAMLLGAPVVLGEPVLAAEGASGTYLLGSKQELAGVLPPPGTYLVDSNYVYRGKANFDLAFAGLTLSGGVKADAYYKLLTLLWVAPGQVLGGNLGFSVTAPIGWKEVGAGASLTGPRGGVISANINESDTGFGDPVLGATLGWHAGNWHWNIGALYNAPLGFWKLRNPSNIGFNRSSLDTTGAITWLDPKIGLELSSAAGFTFNFENPDTRYRTGTEFHVEWAVRQYLSKTLAVGFIGYHYQQVTGDSGAGATLGDFKGRATAIGASLSDSFLLGQIPVAASLKYMKEVEVENRLKGDVGMLTFSMPLSITPPPPTPMK